MIDETPLNHDDGPDALKPCSKTDSLLSAFLSDIGSQRQKK